MTALADRPNTALIVIDAQRGVLADAYDVDNVVARINRLVDRARTSGIPVIWVQHSDEELESGSADWQLVDEVTPSTDETVVHKHYGDAFAGTDLESVLEATGVGTLIVTGAQTDACIRSTLHGSLARGYDTVLVGDAHTTEDLRAWGSPVDPAQAIAYTNMYWSFSAAPDCVGRTVTTDEVDFAH